MSNESERKTETLAGFDIIFVDTKNIIQKSALRKHGIIIPSINNFVDSFLKGYSAIKHNNENFNYYIYSMKMTAYRNNLQVNQFYDVFGPSATQFELEDVTYFFKNCDHTIIKLYVTFNEADKEGLIFRFRINH